MVRLIGGSWKGKVDGGKGEIGKVEGRNGTVGRQDYGLLATSRGTAGRKRGQPEDRNSSCVKGGGRKAEGGKVCRLKLGGSDAADERVPGGHGDSFTEYGAFFLARLARHAGSYSLELTTPSGEHLHTIGVAAARGEGRAGGTAAVSGAGKRPARSTGVFSPNAETQSPQRFGKGWDSFSFCDVLRSLRLDCSKRPPLHQGCSECSARRG
jgi:hypothetical protein